MSPNTHVDGAVYDDANLAATSCLDVPDCRHIGGPVKSCTWDAENHHFVCVHADMRDHRPAPPAAAHGSVDRREGATRVRKGSKGRRGLAR